ncbi:hypothetical protein [Kiloniella sp. EL199]|uniref:hypothetical protein n=1 Tax=Kiloniella sp. EL199 TaxID=2107581 RepID=UPI000EA32069|nr:hypothetical protein [Kiloniella sp. EL199]
MDYTGILYGNDKEQAEQKREQLDDKMFRMFVDGHAGKGNKLTYEQAKWWWRNAGGKPLVVDGRELKVWKVGDEHEIAAPTSLDDPWSLDDLKVHGHVSTNPKNGRIWDGKYDFKPREMSVPEDAGIVDKIRVGSRNFLNERAIDEHGKGTPFWIRYRYEDKDFE